MVKNLELTEDEFVRHRRAMPGSRQARFCSFGLTELVVPLIVGGLTSVGVGATTAGILGTGLFDAGLGALGSAITGGDPLIGAATGGFGGAAGAAFGGDVGSALGISSTQGGAVAGAAGGAFGSAITGGDPLMGALSGGAAGYGGAGYGEAGAIGNVGKGAYNAIPGYAPPPGTFTGATAGAPAPGGGSSAVGGTLGGDLTGGSNYTWGAGAGPGDVAKLGSVGGGAGSVTGALPGAGGAPAIPGVSAAAPAAGAGSGAGGAAAAGGGGAAAPHVSFGDSLIKGLEANPLGDINAVLGITQANKAQSAVNADTTALGKTAASLQKQADATYAQGTSLESSLLTGKLPPGAQAAVDQATMSAKAAIKANYARLGLSGSTMETQDLNAVDTRASGQIFDLAKQLYDSGVTQTGMSNQLYQALLSAQGDVLNAHTNVAQNSNAAITNYAAAISGGNYAPSRAA